MERRDKAQREYYRESGNDESLVCDNNLKAFLELKRYFCLSYFGWFHHWQTE